MPADDPPPVAEVAPEGIEIVNELGKCPRTLAARPSAAALVPPVDAVAIPS
jgi:hypothetical protein